MNHFEIPQSQSLALTISMSCELGSPVYIVEFVKNGFFTYSI